MDFFVTLAGLYALQCLLKIERGHTLGFRWNLSAEEPRGRTALFGGGGWRLAHPWPGAFIFSGRSDLTTGEPGPDVPSLRTSLLEARAKTRGLRWVANVQFLLLFVFGPISALSIGPEATLLYGASPALLLHVSGLFLLSRAQKSISGGPQENGDRLLIAALYPPSLIRSASEIVRVAFENRPIVELVAAAAERSQLETFARREVGRARSSRFGPPDPADAIAWITKVAAQGDIDEATFRAPRTRLDPTASSYCAACEDDYLAGWRFCEDCQLETTPYPE